MPRRLAPALLALATFAAIPARGAPVTVPVLVPLTGFLSLEGTSQLDGALLAIEGAPAGLAVRADVSDTGTAPEAAVNALEKAMRDRGVPAVAASMLGTQMLAMIPIADRYGVPLVTVSGTARITELGSPNVFRFFPGDEVVKTAHARYAVEVLGKRKPAIVYQTTAYGQSGQAALTAALRRLGVEPVLEEGVAPSVKDLVPVLGKVRASGADVLLLHLHAPSTALAVRQAAEMGLGIPIVAGSAMHQPSTAALVEPAELKGVCAETSASPISGGSERMEQFVSRYRKQFHAEPDAYAVGQYDGISMVLAAIANGAKSREAVRQALAAGTWQGLAMTYRSDGKGNMAHSAIIVCYDGTSRVPRIVTRYDDVAVLR